MNQEDFSWTTEDETAWEVESTETPAPAPRRWVTPLVLLGALLLSALFYWQLQRQAEAVAADIEADVRASVDVLFAASAAGDAELFKSMLSGRDLAWAEAQQELVMQRGVLDRSAINLALADDVPQIENVYLTPDLFSAEVTLTVPYDGATLQLPITLRKGATQWLYAPAADDFWGETIIQESVYLISRYSERDAALITRLIADLDEFIRKSGTVEFGFYPPEKQVQVTFSNQPATLLPLPFVFDSEILALPTPTLIGLPTDEAGYRALLNYYAAHVYAPVYSAEFQYAFKNDAFFRAQYEWTLSTLGIAPWTLTAADRSQLLQEVDDFYLHARGWHKTEWDAVTSSELRLARGIVDFVARSQFAEPLTLAQRINLRSPSGLPDPAFSSWVDAILREMTVPALDDAVDVALYAALTQLRPEPLPIAPPVERPMLACDQDDAGAIFSYDWQFERFGLFSTVQMPVAYIHSLPKQNGLWVGQDAMQAFLLSNRGRVVRLPERLRYFGVHSPDGQTLAAMRVGTSGQSTNSQMSLIDLTSCSADSCQLSAARWGQVQWSPDGQHQLIRDFQNQRTVVVDNSGNQIKSLNRPPQQGMAIWVDANTVGWFDSAESYVKSTLDSDEVVPWIALSDIRAQLPPTPIAQPTVRIYDAGTRSNPFQKIVQVYDDVTPLYMLLHDPGTNQTIYLPELDDTFFLNPSPGGQWLTAAAFEDGNSDGRLTELILHNPADNLTRRYPYSSASRLMFPTSTDEWGMIFEREKVRLIAPTHNYVRHLLPPAANCSSAAWMNLNSAETGGWRPAASGSR